mmetsp:Transcript_12725/g.44578  ORF Transcript_12725/g.44578 Transcript_12725/m.44578 type:complete len:365 (+) Transcript_12725:43-1137(+)
MTQPPSQLLGRQVAALARRRDVRLGVRARAHRHPDARKGPPRELGGARDAHHGGLLPQHHLHEVHHHEQEHDDEGGGLGVHPRVLRVDVRLVAEARDAQARLHVEPVVALLEHSRQPLLRLPVRRPRTPRARRCAGIVPFSSEGVVDNGGSHPLSRSALSSPLPKPPCAASRGLGAPSRHVVYCARVRLAGCVAVAAPIAAVVGVVGTLHEQALQLRLPVLLAIVYHQPAPCTRRPVDPEHCSQGAPRRRRSRRRHVVGAGNRAAHRRHAGVLGDADAVVVIIDPKPLELVFCVAPARAVGQPVAAAREAGVKSAARVVDVVVVQGRVASVRARVRACVVAGKIGHVLRHQRLERAQSLHVLAP